MDNSNEEIEIEEEIAIELNREPTSEETEEALADREAQEIDAAYEQARADQAD